MVMIMGCRRYSRCVDGQPEVPILARKGSARPLPLLVHVAVVMSVPVTVAVIVAARMPAVAVRAAHAIQPTLLVAMFAGTAEVVAVNPGSNRPLLGLKNNLTALFGAALELKDVVSIGYANDVIFALKRIAGPQVNARRANNFDPLARLRRDFQVASTIGAGWRGRCYVRLQRTQTDNNGQHG